jgi:hypothetical protein
MSLKSKVFAQICAHLDDDQHCTMSHVDWRNFQREANGLQLKYPNGKNQPILLNFSGRGPWFTPEQFWRDFVLQNQAKFLQAGTVLSILGPEFLECTLATRESEVRHAFEIYLECDFTSADSWWEEHYGNSDTGHVKFEDKD